MKLARKALFLVLASGMVLAQANPPATSPTATNPVSDELKQLRQALAEQQKLMVQQQQQMAQQQQQMTEQQQKIDALQKALEAGTSATPHVENASLNTTSTTSGPITQSDTEKPKESPLSFRIGGAEFTPGGFVDFENIFRSTNTGNVSATNFGAIPFSNTIQGHLTEYRSTGQYSRFNLKTHALYGANNITGYIEFDFNGNDPANVFVTSNSHTDRLRLFWLDLKRGNWEFLGGQTWGLQTPNRIGVSPNPADLSLGYNEDAGIGVGYNYTRAAAFRAAYHFSDHFVWAVEAQNPQQFVGAGEVIFPFAFNAQLGPQFDAANNPGAPNVGPDFHTKFAYDSNTSGGKNFHLELGALESTTKITVLPVGGTAFASHSAIGGAAFGALNYDLFKGAQGRGLRFVSSGMWGNGVGRYLNGLAPNAVIVPIATGPGTFDAEPSLIHSGDVVFGLELAPHPKTQFGFYYGGMYAQRNAPQDVTNPVPGRFAGFGGPNSPNSANRAVQEGTIDWTQTFWKNPQYGAVLLVTQASYLTRAPWFVAAGAPKNAHLTMGYVSVRYILP
jgi:hypothetical protein